MNLLWLAGVLLGVEIGLFLIVNLQRRSFPWLITKRDDSPPFDAQALKKFIEYSFDPHLGWVRKPNSRGTEHGLNGPITFHIDSSGSRANICEQWPQVVAAFGDSYAFCRQVEDEETWEAHLSQQEGIGVLNFGVGNYGVDQALLRYECTFLPETVQVVVMAFVPETICRIQSCWKHYLEFGNTFAFKPRFKLDSEGRLIFLENNIRRAEDFAGLRESLPRIRDADGFYVKKFRSYQFRFPYTLSMMRHPLNHSMLISAVGVRAVLRAVGVPCQVIEDLPFTLVMKRNLREAFRQYHDIHATALLDAILLRFREEAKRRGHIPLIVVIPQLLDLSLNRNAVPPYQGYFNELARQLPVLDLTETFINAGFRKLYINDQYGGHLSVDGNRLVANEISNWLKVKHESGVL